MDDSSKGHLLASLRREIRDERVLEAMARVPRERFAPPELQHLAYQDTPLPIGEGQTISQPFMVALMTQELVLTGNEKVLEIGTGSGYQAAVLAELARQVVTVERVSSLAARAQAMLTELGYANVEVHLAHEDRLGWPEGAPYDAILVTAAAPRVPPSLLRQLGVGGRLVVPVGTREDQDLVQVRKEEGRLHIRRVAPCRFVPLLGPDGWAEANDADGRMA